MVQVCYPNSNTLSKVKNTLSFSPRKSETSARYLNAILPSMFSLYEYNFLAASSRHTRGHITNINFECSHLKSRTSRPKTHSTHRRGGRRHHLLFIRLCSPTSRDDNAIVKLARHRLGGFSSLYSCGFACVRVKYINSHPYTYVGKVNEPSDHKFFKITSQNNSPQPRTMMSCSVWRS